MAKYPRKLGKISHKAHAKHRYPRRGEARLQFGYSKIFGNGLAARLRDHSYMKV
jgi:hypothetical protein